MNKSTTVAAIQSSFDRDRQTNIKRMDDLVRHAASAGSRIILMPELFEGWYFPQNEYESDFSRAHPVEDHPTIGHFQKLADELSVALPVSFFEKASQEYYNSLAMIDADGRVLGIYRKSHIPAGPGYHEKFFFRPGNTGYTVWKTRFGTIGTAICWDQWFPEAARAMVLAGADILFYPTAIGSEPQEPGLDTRDPWRRVMQGHAVANACAVVAANRVGAEQDIQFYGSSFICDHRGELVAEMGRQGSGYIQADINFEQVQEYRAAFGFFRDRRTDLSSF